MKELEEKLNELEGRHIDLTHSYETLQLEYSRTKQEMDRLREEKEKPEGSYWEDPNHTQTSNLNTGTYDESTVLDPCFFDLSVYTFDQGEGGTQTGDDLQRLG